MAVVHLDTGYVLEALQVFFFFAETLILFIISGTKKNCH